MIELKPGPELDALVAEKIMGLRTVIYQTESSMFSPKAYWSPGNECYLEDIHYVVPADVPEEAQDDYVYNHPDAYLPEYSSDMGAAWPVVERLGLTWDVDLSRHFTGKCACVFIRTGNYLDTRATADTAPLAICLAALKTVGAVAKEVGSE